MKTSGARFSRRHAIHCYDSYESHCNELYGRENNGVFLLFVILLNRTKKKPNKKIISMKIMQNVLGVLKLQHLFSSEPETPSGDPGKALPSLSFSLLFVSLTRAYFNTKKRNLCKRQYCFIFRRLIELEFSLYLFGDHQNARTKHIISNKMKNKLARQIHVQMTFK